MRSTWFRGLSVLGLFILASCGQSASDAPITMPDMTDEGVTEEGPTSQLVGAWSLDRIERRDATGELAGPAIEDRLGYLIYDATGYMAVTLMRPDRASYSEGGPTPEEALAQLGSYTSYFGRYSVNASEGFVTHHLEGSLNPRGSGADYQRFYSVEGDRLTLQPPASESGARSFITWERLPDLPESELTDTHRRLFGFYRIESVSRQTSDGDVILADPYETAYIIYTPSGHMSVHLMRPGRQPYAGEQPTAEEALMTVETYGSYFGPFSVDENEGYLVHHRIGNENPGASGTDAQRFFELTDTHLTLRPPSSVDTQGREVQSALRWARISD